MGDIVKKILPVAATIIGSQFGPLGAAAGSALATKATGGDWGDAARAGITGGATSYFGPMVGEGLNSGLGLELPIGGSAVKAIGGALTGAGAGAVLEGGARGALKNAISGGAGGFLSGGGLSDIGLTGESGLLGTKAGSPLEGGAQGPTQGSGVLGSATRGLSNISSALNIGGAGGSSYSNLIPIAGAVNSYMANEQAQDDLLESQDKAMGALDPYLRGGGAANRRLSELLGIGGNRNASDYGALNKPFDPGNLEDEPGYKFQRDQGLDSINRTLGAKGSLFSGAALRAAQDYGQGLASQTYKDAYQRYVQDKNDTYNRYAGRAGAGQNAAGAAGNIYSDIGNARANAGISSANIINSALSSLLSGRGAYKLDAYGNPIYI